MRRPGVMVVSASGNVPKTTIDFRVYIGNDSYEDIMNAVRAAQDDFSSQVHHKLIEMLKLPTEPKETE